MLVVQELETIVAEVKRIGYSERYYTPDSPLQLEAQKTTYPAECGLHEIAAFGKSGQTKERLNKLRISRFTGFHSA